MFGARWGGRATRYDRGRKILGQGDGRCTHRPHEDVHYVQNSTFSSHFTLQHLRQLCLWFWSSLLLDRKLCWSSKPSLLPLLCVGLGVPSLAFHFRLCGGCGGQHILFSWFSWPGFWCQRQSTDWGGFCGLCAGDRNSGLSAVEVVQAQCFLERVKRPQAGGECSHLDVWKEPKWSCSCFWWSFGLFPNVEMAAFSSGLWSFD